MYRLGWRLICSHPWYIRFGSFGSNSNEMQDEPTWQFINWKQKWWKLEGTQHRLLVYLKFNDYWQITVLSILTHWAVPFVKSLKSRVQWSFCPSGSSYDVSFSRAASRHQQCSGNGWCSWHSWEDLVLSWSCVNRSSGVWYHWHNACKRG